MDPRSRRAADRSPGRTLILVLAIAALAAVATWWLLERVFSTPSARTPSPTSERDAPAKASPASRSNPEASRARDVAPSSSPRPAESGSALVLYPVDRTSGDLEVEVFDVEGGSTAGVAVTLRSTLGGFQPGLEIADDRAFESERATDGSGHVAFPGVAQGPWRLSAVASDGRHAKADVVFRATLDEPPFRLVLGARSEETPLAVHVAGRDGRSVAGASVEVTGSWPDHGALGGPRLPPLTKVADADGRVTFDAMLEQTILFARAPDGRVGTNLATRGRTECDEAGAIWQTVVVDAPATIEGRFTGVAPELTDGLEVFADFRSGEVPGYWSWGTTIGTTAAGGAFRLEGLPAGRAALRIGGHGGLRIVAPPMDLTGSLPNSAQPIVVPLEAGATKAIELPLAIGGTIRGQVRTAGGAPVADAVVRDVFAPRSTQFPEGVVLHGVNVWRFDCDNQCACDHPFTHVTANSDAKGEYVLAGLQPGLHRVEVTAPRLSLDRREGVTVSDGATVVLDPVLEEAGVLQGVASERGYFGVTRAGREEPFAIAILGASRTFTFSALPAGEYVLSQFTFDDRDAPVDLARARVVAGRTTWVDLSGVPTPRPITGTLVDGDGPVAGARVGFDERAAPTGRDGRFLVPRCFTDGELVPLRIELDGMRFLALAHEQSASDGPLDVLVRLPDERLEVATAGEGARERSGVLALALDGPQSDLSVPLVERCAIPFDARGRILVRHLARTSYLVTARFADGSTRTARVELPSDGPLDLSPLPCGEIEVVVRDAAGRRVRGCGVAIATWLGDGEIPADVEGHDEWFEWRSGATDRTGRFCARGVRAGRVRIRASGTDTEPLLERTLEARFVLVEDEHRTIDMTLPPPQDGGR